MSSIVAKANGIVGKLSGTVKFPALPKAPASKPGKRIFIISADQSLEGLSRQVTGAVDAAKLLGWTTTVVDGKSSPDAMTAGVEEAVNQKADGILLINVTKSLIGAGFAEAKKAGIPMVEVGDSDPVGGSGGVDGAVFGPAMVKVMGEDQGWYAISASEGKAKVIVLRDNTDPAASIIATGTIDVLDKCSTCQVTDDLSFTEAQLVTGLSGQVQTALIKHPTTNYILAPYDAAITFAQPGIRASRSSAVAVGTGGNASNLQLIQKHELQVATVGEPYEWVGAGGINQLIWLLAGKTPPVFPVPLKILTAANLPSGGKAWMGDEAIDPILKAAWK